jgi:hypothetical protein
MKYHAYLMLLLASGCTGNEASDSGPFVPPIAATGQRDAEPRLLHDPAIERKPRLLLDPSIDVASLSYRGVRLGEPAGVIDQHWISEISNQWILCKDGSRFGTRNAMVITLGVWDSETVASMKVASPDEIVAALGKPTAVTESTIGAERIAVYRFDTLRRRFVWNLSSGKLLAVNVGDFVTPD